MGMINLGGQWPRISPVAAGLREQHSVSHETTHNSTLVELKIGNWTHHGKLYRKCTTKLKQ